MGVSLQKICIEFSGCMRVVNNNHNLHPTLRDIPVSKMSLHSYCAGKFFCVFIAGEQSKPVLFVLWMHTIGVHSYTPVSKMNL